MDQAVELFCGKQKTFTVMAHALGLKTFTIDRNPECRPDLVADIAAIDFSKLPIAPLIVWASPPDEGFSDDSWRGVKPLNSTAKNAIATLRAGIATINSMAPQWWFVENPSGLLRSLPVFSSSSGGNRALNRQTVRHGDYGGRRLRETDIWTNAFWWTPRSRARATKAGMDTGRRVPPMVFAEIFAQLEIYRVTKLYGPRYAD